MEIPRKIPRVFGEKRTETRGKGIKTLGFFIKQGAIGDMTRNSIDPQCVDVSKETITCDQTRIYLYSCNELLILW